MNNILKHNSSNNNIIIQSKASDQVHQAIRGQINPPSLDPKKKKTQTIIIINQSLPTPTPAY